MRDVLEPALLRELGKKHVAILLSRNDDVWRISLEGGIDVGVAAELQANLLDGLAAEKRICVSLGGVTDLDVAGFQLLWAAQREAEQRGKEFVLEGPLRKSVRGTLENAGLTGLAISE